MAIDISKYVDIVSGVGGVSLVPQRDLIGRLFTTSTRVPVDTIVTVDSAADVNDYFGSTSQEALRAAFYFAFVSKSITSPPRLSFARWADVAAVPQIFGAAVATTLAAWQQITSGTLTVTLGDDTVAITGLNFSAAASLAGVAAILQTAVRAASGTQFPTATVSYDAPSQTYNLSGTVAEAAAVSLTDSGANDIRDELGWSSVSTILSPGVDATSLTDALDDNAAASNNFGSFAFVPALTDEQVVEVATWNAGRNVEFIYCVPTVAGSAVTRSAALWDLPGTALTLVDAALPNEYDEMVPMIILAATDYTRRNSTQNYMYYQFNLTPKVSSTTNSNAYDSIRVNYYGVTQTAGQMIAFYQRGTMMGGATAAVDQNVYANEIWLKDRAASALMALLLALPRIPANVEGRAMVLTVLQDAVNAGLFNGVISVGKTLTVNQKLYIGQITGDPDAWFQVQGVGFWVNVVITPYTTDDDRTEYQAVYTLVYAKDDAIRRVEGTHVLI